jgi:hypothetical protein
LDNVYDFSKLPHDYPPIPRRGYTQEEMEILIENTMFLERQAIKELEAELDTVGYVEVCSLTHVTATEWFGLNSDPFYSRYGLPDLYQEALKSTVTLVNKQIKDRRDKEIGDLKLQNMQANKGLNGISNGPSLINKIFDK